MIDLHCHLLAAIDDGSPDWATSVEMARIAVAEGITVAACTPHIMPGVYDNTAAGIQAGVAHLAAMLADANIPLKLVAGADVHLAPNLVTGLAGGIIPTLAGSRYVLVEPPHHIAPPRMEESVFALSANGYVPVITHPERLAWIETHAAIIERLADQGVWMQVTAGSLTGRFGARARYWAERLLDQGRVDILATDAHDTRRRPPLLAEALRAAAKRIGDDEARRLVLDRPQAILDDAAPPASRRPRDRERKGPFRFWPWRFGNHSERERSCDAL